MDVVPFVIAVLGVLAAMVGVAVQQRAKNTLHDELEALGLKGHGGETYTGEHDGLTVSFEVPRKNGRHIEQRVIVTPFLVPDFIGPHVARPFRPVVLTGDPAFDRSRAVCGDEAAVRAALDAPTRRILGAGQVVVQYGQLVARNATVSNVPSVIELALQLRNRFHATDDERRSWLEANVRGDPVPGVRERSLETLGRMEGGLARLDALARAAELDESLRASAAILAGSADVLAVVAASTTDGDRLAAATAALGTIGSLELPSALERVRVFVRESPSQSLVDVLGRYGAVADVPVLQAIDGAALRSAVREAVRAIQGRIVGAADGALALAPPAEHGDMSIAETGGLAVTRTGKGDPPS